MFYYIKTDLNVLKVAGGAGGEGERGDDRVDCAADGNE
jgi:hypothetical protein